MSLFKYFISIKKLLFILSAIVFVACSQKEDLPGLPGPIKDQSVLLEQAFPNQTGEFREGYYDNKPITYEVINGQYVYEGDMMLDKSRITSTPQNANDRTTSVGIIDRRWTDNMVYYSISPDLPNPQRVTQAIADFEAKTFLRFKERTNEPNYIHFIKSDGCWSHVGMIGGEQEIGLGDGCSAGTTIHEIGHAVGLLHEQSRIDRDNHITIHWDRIKHGKKGNFNLRTDDASEYGTAFDFSSVMMYHPYAFSDAKSGSGKQLPTITKKDGSLYETQRHGLSSLDVVALNTMYPPVQAIEFLPLKRFYNSNRQTYRYITGTKIGNAFQYEKTVGKLAPLQISGTQKFHHYININTKKHFYSADFSEWGRGGGLIRYKGNIGYIYTESGSFRKPLYRYYNQSIDAYFYTDDFDELGSGKNGYVYQKVAGYVER
ncbi:M12 family metallopeptidase [uncultured Microscilla sp.]|uniref:M12 family metallopeptidase n=1 Tax=uncultured Microscilla sp. TaxID=432653 RepID=UPI0026102DA1|nr:M12 family metallopeptidase [uncultured Microscilla sp.]